MKFHQASRNSKFNMRKTAKTVIITDGCRGIGAACAKKYAENGFNIVIVGTEGEMEIKSFLRISPLG